MLGFRDVFPELVEKLNGHIRTGYFWREQPQLAEQSCLHKSTRWLFAANDDFFWKWRIGGFHHEKEERELGIWSANICRCLRVLRSNQIPRSGFTSCRPMAWWFGLMAGDWEIFLDVLGHLGASWDILGRCVKSRHSFGSQEKQCFTL